MNKKQPDRRPDEKPAEKAEAAKPAEEAKTEVASASSEALPPVDDPLDPACQAFGAAQKTRTPFGPGEIVASGEKRKAGDLQKAYDKTPTIKTLVVHHSCPLIL